MVTVRSVSAPYMPYGGPEARCAMHCYRASLCNVRAARQIGPGINGPGQVVLRSGRTSGIDVRSLARGTYYVLAIDEGNTFSSSFIKE